MAVDVAPSLPPAAPGYPAWWKPGVLVVGLGGECGWIQGADDKWTVQTKSGYTLRPDPAYWSPFQAPIVSPIQRDHIAYEAGAAMYEAFGAGGIRHWGALSPAERIDGALPEAKFRSELTGLRAVLMAAVKAALEPYVK